MNLILIYLIAGFANGAVIAACLFQYHWLGLFPALVVLATSSFGAGEWPKFFLGVFKPTQGRKRKAIQEEQRRSRRIRRGLGRTMRFRRTGGVKRGRRVTGIVGLRKGG